MSNFSLSGGGTAGPFKAEDREDLAIVVGDAADFAGRTLTVEVEGAADDWLAIATKTSSFEILVKCKTGRVRLSLDGAATPVIDGVALGA